MASLEVQGQENLSRKGAEKTTGERDVVYRKETKVAKLAARLACSCDSAVISNVVWTVKGSVLGESATY